MLSRRTFGSIAVTGIASVSGISFLATESNSDPKASMILKLINQSGSDAVIEASIDPTNTGSTVTRQSHLSKGERKHYHLRIDSGETYDIQASARLSFENATTESNNIPDDVNVSFDTVPASKTTTLQDKNWVKVQLTSDEKMGILVV